MALATSPTIVTAQGNTAKTSGSSAVQFQREASMETNPREKSRGERDFREASRRLAYVGETSPTTVNTQTKTGDDFAHTFHTSSCLSALQIGKRQDGMFSYLTLRL